MTADGQPAQADRRRTLETLADELRPQLHRYAARLVGSVIDGEDVVQDALARAFLAIDDLPVGVPLRPWLFRITHNRAVDVMRRERRRAAEPMGAAEDLSDPAALDPETALLHREAVAVALGRFADLPLAQRATVVLKDVLGESLTEIAALLDLSVDAVKAHLARGRARLIGPAPAAAAPPPRVSAQAQQFAELFNRQDWAALRSLLAEDVRLNQARRPLRRGAGEVGRFFTFYADYPPVRLQPAWLEGREIHLVFARGERQPRYFMRLTWDRGRITAIHDHRYADYIIDGADYAPRTVQADG